MLAVTNNVFGGPEVLSLSSVPDPIPRDEEILVEVYATALNRADILQRQGKYPPPSGASTVLGIEMAGIVKAIGKNVKKWQHGDPVFGLLPGGGYATLAVIHQDMAMRIPAGLSMMEAAAIPEVFLTAYQALFLLAKLQPNEKLLVHAGASGVGTAIIQLAKTKEAMVLATASAPTHDTCLKLGADHVFDYSKGTFTPWVMQQTEDKGVDVIVDFIGGNYFSENINCMQIDGRLVQLATMGGTRIADFNLGLLLRKRLNIIGSTLRNRSIAYQIELTRAFEEYALEKFQNKTLVPVIGKVFAMEEVQEAHRYMEANKNVGKIVLEIKNQ